VRGEALERRPQDPLALLAAFGGRRSSGHPRRVRSAAWLDSLPPRTGGSESWRATYW